MLEWELPGEPLGPRGPAGKEGWLEEEVFLLGPWEKAEGAGPRRGSCSEPFAETSPHPLPQLFPPLSSGEPSLTTQLNGRPACPQSRSAPLSSRRPGHVPLENWCWKRSLHIGGTAIFVALVPLARIYQ